MTTRSFPLLSRIVLSLTASDDGGSSRPLPPLFLLVSFDGPATEAEESVLLGTAGGLSLVVRRSSTASSIDKSRLDEATRDHLPEVCTASQGNGLTRYTLRSPNLYQLTNR
jgi:hypothetical protein